MLRLEIIDDKGQPRRINAARFVAFDVATGNPVALGIAIGGPACYVSCTQCDDFNPLLRELGVYNTVVTTTYSPQPISVT